ncbi:MAG TPA: histidine kinase [Polyangiaceae bacterium]
MHPLLTDRRSLLAYLAFWACLAAVPWVLLPSHTPFGALAVALASSIVFALATLPVWYLCRALPLLAARIWRTLSIHAAAAAAWGTLFLLCMKLSADVLSLWPAWHALPAEVGAAEAALLGVGALFYLLVTAFHYVLTELEARRDATEREAALALAAQRAELAALRSQVHPHFLFNSLNTVSALIGYDGAKAREACLLLAEYLRGTLGAQEHALVSLEDEWKLCEGYLKVEALRLGERLRLELDLEPSALPTLVPSLLLQPLVENAVTHGIAPVDEPLPLRIRARVREGRLAIALENGVDPAPRARPSGMGLANVRARLFGQYGDDATLRVERDDARFAVALDLPARRGEDRKAP